MSSNNQQYVGESNAQYEHSGSSVRRAYVPPHLRGKQSAEPPVDRDIRNEPPQQPQQPQPPQQPQQPARDQKDDREQRPQREDRRDDRREFDRRDDRRADDVRRDDRDRFSDRPPREDRDDRRFGGRDERGFGFNRGSSRGGYGGGDRRDDRPSYRDDRAPREDRPSTGGSTRFSRDDARAGGSSRGPTMERNERLELELFGVKKESSGIEFKNYEDIPVETSGKDVPEPIQSFKDMDIHEVLKSNIELSGYDHPTPVQRHALPIALNGRDIMACAQTGSGKTAAFLFPVIQMMLRTEIHLNPRGGNGRRRALPAALVLAPTRELATQIFNEARKFVYRTGVKPVVVYGGQEPRLQLREIENGVDLLVATPGRLVDFVDRGRISLANVGFLIFDEADRMLDMGFEPQIRQIVQEMDMPVNDRQTLMFSATFPKEIQRLAQDFLKDYVFLAVGRVGSTTDFITQKVEYAGTRESEKIDRLLAILEKCEGLTLIFVETKRNADYLENVLVQEGIEATSIHGDRTQDERERALQYFRCGRCPVLVATDVASRGLDIPDVRVVINYDLPNNIDDYVHRIGRTGRAGKKGTAIAFIEEKKHAILREVYDIMKENNQELPSWFENLVFGHGGGGFSRGGGGGGRSGGRGPATQRGAFGGRDVRREDSWGSSSAPSHHAPAPAPAPAARQQQAPPQRQQQQQAPQQQQQAPPQSFRPGSNRGGSYDSW